MRHGRFRRPDRRPGAGEAIDRENEGGEGSVVRENLKRLEPLLARVERSTQTERAQPVP